ncbi:MAG: aminopeptidase P family protein [Dehalococcoidia bacterium]|uniref:aminopeptidase P family protein n=1 Tax=Candidatus Amarobacter glycogenicus TaxID=3140699 RepID=UPI003135071B|nr:aminopeptidase P family protein [Dehalococcoidia bacterium]
MAKKRSPNARLDRIREALDEAKLDALMISSPGEENLGMASRYYTSGFTGSAGVVLVTREQAIIAADFRYTEQAERECVPRGFEVFPALGGRKEWFAKFAGEAGIAGKRVGLATHDTTYAGRLSLTALSRALPAADRPKWLPAPDIIGRLRKVKDPGELVLLQRAIDISDAAFERLERDLTPETTEVRAAEMFAANVKAEGGDDISFETIVAGGPNGAMPHAHPTAAAVGADRPIVIDMGAKSGGYCSDLTRTIVLGKRDAKFREIYEIVFEAQRAAIEGVEVGMKTTAAHMLAQDVIDRAGYGDRFGHGLGHGVGLAVHEDPYLGKSGADTLEEGMVFTIEPGIYLPGWGGVRIEDVVALENGRARVLSKANKLSPTGVSI